MKNKSRLDEYTTEITATGVIVPATWNRRGKPVSIMLATYNEEEFLISMDTEAGGQLQNQLHKKVCVIGTVGRVQKNKWKIKVERFEVVKEDANADEAS